MSVFERVRFSWMGNRMDPSRERDFTAFYDATWPRTVACVYALTGDLDVAQDLAQEAYSRAWPRWSSLYAYDDPGAWVRHVATRLAVSRWRRTRTTAVFLARSRGPERAAPPSEATTRRSSSCRSTAAGCGTPPLRRALCGRDRRDRQVPEGTIKARLSRGRAALKTLLAPQDGEHSHA